MRFGEWEHLRLTLTLTLTLTLIGEWDHLRRQIYSLTTWNYAKVQFVTINVLEWPKDTRARYPNASSDTWRSYLGTTVDRLHVDLHRVYTAQPLIPFGGPSSFDSVGAAAAAEVLTWRESHWVFYLGCRAHHEELDSDRLTLTLTLTLIGGIGLKSPCLRCRVGHICAGSTLLPHNRPRSGRPRRN